MVECFVVGLERNNSHSSDGSSGPWILNADISHIESGMAMDILFKPRIETTQRNR